MKIIGSRSYIIVDYDHRNIKIIGELTTTPIFYADIASIKKWEPPFDNIEVTEKGKVNIIQRITDETKNKELKIIFD